MEKLISSFLIVGQGLAFTLELTIAGLCLGIALGSCLSILRHSHLGASIINGVISILRGTPLILQLSFVYFTTPTLIGVKLNILSAGILTFGLNSAAYIAEIIRSGIESLPRGQFEAAKTLEIPSFYMWKDIIFPQVIRNTFPAIVSEVIALIKETALIGTIGGMDLMRMAQILGAEQFSYFMPLCIAAAYYYMLVLLVEQIGKRFEKQLAFAKN